MNYIIITFFIITQLCFPQPWKNISKLGEQVGRPSGFMTDGENLYLASYYETDFVLSKSTDKGKTWFQQYRVETISEFGDIYSVRNAVLVDKKYIYAAFTYKRSIAKSTNGGQTFEMINLGEGDGVYRVCMYNRYIGIAITNDDLIVTEDGWKTYRTVRHKYGPSYISPIFTDEYNLQFINTVNKATGISNFNLNSNEWSRFYSFEKDNKDVFLNLEYTENGLGFLAGLRRNGNGDRATDILYQSTDNGKTWINKINEDVEPQWGIDHTSFNDTLNGFATGQFGKILMTNDGGKTWNYVKDLDFYVDSDSTYGPFTTEILWMDDKPYIMSGFANVYSIDTDYFALYDRYNISGTVLNNGEPVYVPLRKDSKVQYTYDDGSYEFEKVPNGKYTIAPEPSSYFSYEPASIEVTVNDNVANQNFVAIRKQFQLTGELNNRVNADISDLKFRIEYKTTNGLEYSVDTLIGLTEATKFVAENMYATKQMKIVPMDEEASYKVIPSEYNVDFISDTTLKFDILSKEGNYSISGKFHLNGKGIEDVQILASSEGRETFEILHTDENGNYRFYDVKPGMAFLYILSIDRPLETARPGTYSLDVSSHLENVDFEMEDREYIRVRGRVTDKEGKGIPNIRVLPFEQSIGLFEDTIGVRTRADGRFTSDFLRPDHPQLIVELQDYFNFSPAFYTLDVENKLDGYDFVMDTVITDVPYRIHRDISLYPNPATSQISVDLDGGLLVSYYKIIDTEGRVVLSNIGGFTSTQTIEVQQLPAGTYMIELTTTTGDLVRDKFVKR